MRQSHTSPLKTIVPVGVGIALSLSGDLALYTILPAQAVLIGLTNIGILLSANRFIRFLSNPLVGKWSDRFHWRPMFLAGLILGCCSNLFYVLDLGFYFFLLGRLMWGCAWSLILINAYRAVFSVTQDDNRGWGAGLLQMFIFAGYIISPLIGGVLNNTIGFSSTMAVCGAVSCLGLLVVVISTPSAGAASPQKMPQQSRSVSLHSILDLLSDRQILSINYLIFLVFFIGDGLILSTIALFISQEFPERSSILGLSIQSTGISGILLTLRAAVSALSAPFAGKLSDYLRRPWLVLGAAGVTGISGLLILITAHTLPGLALGSTLLALYNGAAITVLASLVGQSGPENQKGLALAVFTTVGDLGCAIAPMVGYLLLNKLPISALYLICAAALATGLPVAWRFARQHS